MGALSGGPDIAWHTIEGPNEGGRAFVPRGWSRDGRRLVRFTLVQGSATPVGIAVYDVETHRRTDLTKDVTRAVSWLPDSRHIV